MTAKVDSRIAELPVGHLRLVGRAHNVAARARSIGQLMQAVSQPDQQFDTYGIAVAEIRYVLDVLISKTAACGWKGWDRFRRSRRLHSPYPELFFASPEFDRLAAHVSRLSVEALHLSSRAVRALQSCGVGTIGVLIHAARSGLTRVRGGHRTATEAITALNALANSVSNAGGVDWMSYAAGRAFEVLPERARRSYSAAEFLRALPAVALAAAERRFGGFGLIIVQKRLLGPAVRHITQPQLAAELGIGTALIQLKEREIINMFNAAALHYRYADCDFRFRDGFFAPLQDLRDVVERRRIRRVTPDEWYKLLFETWRVRRSDVDRKDLILSRLLGVDVADNAWRYQS